MVIPLLANQDLTPMLYSAKVNRVAAVLYLECRNMLIVDEFWALDYP